MRGSLKLIIAGALLGLLVACDTPKGLKLEPVSYDSISGWSEDSHSEALSAFVASCGRPISASGDELRPHIDEDAWLVACGESAKYLSQGDAGAQAFFEAYFEPHQMSYGKQQDGLLTGYYIPVIEGSLSRTEEYRWPVYGVPPGLQKGVSYYNRAEIESGAMKGKGLEIAWVKDRVMLFFMQIQGSGRLQLPDGRMMVLQYAGQNGHSYTPIGRVLADAGEIPPEEVSLQSIREWLYRNPDRADGVMNQNESYVFFALVKTDDMPKGAQGVPLTAERSLAADASIMPYGLPVYVETYAAHKDEQEARAFRKLLIVQDTGGAIKGPMRGDIFFGQGPDAEHKAGLQKQDGRWVVLLPTQRGSHDTQIASGR